MQGCGRGFLQALAATWVVSVLLMVLLLLAPELVLSFFADAKVMPFAKTYCMIRWVPLVVVEELAAKVAIFAL